MERWALPLAKWISFDNPVDRVVFDEYLLAVEQAESRLRSIDAELGKAAELPLYRDHVWLRRFHGIDTVTGLIFVAELHGIDRFHSPRQLAG